MVPSAFGIGWCPLRLHVSECIECPNWCPTRLKLRFAILGRWVDGWMNIGWGVLARVRGPKLIGWLCVCVCGVGGSRRNEWMSSLVELSFNSTSPGIVVGSWLFCIQHFFFLCLVSFFLLHVLMIVIVEVWNEEYYVWYLWGSNLVGRAMRGAKTRLTLNEPKQVALNRNSNTTIKHAPKVEKN